MKRKGHLVIGLVVIVLALWTIALNGMAQSGDQPTQVAAAAKININQADAAQLEGLPGIGAKTAEQIVKHRETQGAFKSIEELKKIKGIGEKTFEKIKERITVE